MKVLKIVVEMQFIYHLLTPESPMLKPEPMNDDLKKQVYQVNNGTMSM